MVNEVKSAEDSTGPGSIPVAARQPPARVGIIGYGTIGRRLVAAMKSDPMFEVAFVHNRSATTGDLPEALVLEDLAKFADRDPELIVEVSHPSFTVEHGLSFLTTTDYMPLSTTALVDDRLRAGLVAAAVASGRRLLLPHGALVGLESLLASRHVWDAVTITFVKSPEHLIPAMPAGEFDPRAETVLFEGPVRRLANRYPQNVNSMVTLALATVGLDRCTARLVADPSATQGVLDIEAVGKDGSVLRVRRSQPMVGVSGTEMFDSLMASVRAAVAVPQPGMSFV